MAKKFCEKCGYPLIEVTARLPKDFKVRIDGCYTCQPDDTGDLLHMLGLGEGNKIFFNHCCNCGQIGGKFPAPVFDDMISVTVQLNDLDGKLTCAVTAKEE